MLYLVDKDKPVSYKPLLVTLICVTVVVVLFMSISALHRHRLIGDPLSLSRQSDIQDASEILIDIALSGNEDSASEAREKLEAIMLKLLDGWNGIVDDTWGPDPFRGKNTPGDTLRLIYWELATRVAQQDDWANREEMLVRIQELIPPKPRAFRLGFEYGLKKKGLVSLLEKKDSSNPTHFDTIKAAIVRMLERPEGAFLIVEEPDSGKFVQFVGSRDEPLLLDLPLQTLSPEEATKARAVFVELGYPDAIPAQGDPDAGDPANSQWQSATVSFGDDVDGAAKLAVAVLHDVYGFDETVKLELTEE